MIKDIPSTEIVAEIAEKFCQRLEKVNHKNKYYIHQNNDSDCKEAIETVQYIVAGYKI